MATELFILKLDLRRLSDEDDEDAALNPPDDDDEEEDDDVEEVPDKDGAGEEVVGIGEEKLDE